MKTNTDIGSSHLKITNIYRSSGRNYSPWVNSSKTQGWETPATAREKSSKAAKDNQIHI